MGGVIQRGLEDVGEVVILLVRTLQWLFRPPFRFWLMMTQLEFVGAGSFFIVLLTGTFSGLVLSVQLIDGFARFDAESLTGSTIAIALCREIGPVLTALIVTGRVASAMATEIGTMKVTEQIDALLTMAVSPIQYLVVPRVIAGVAMLPVLTMFYNVLGMAGTWYVCVEVAGIDEGVFWRRINTLLKPADITVGVVKAAVFGLCITLVACHKGMNASGGARGVGQATTQAVVFNIVAIFVLDYIVTAIWMA